MRHFSTRTRAKDVTLIDSLKTEKKKKLQLAQNRDQWYESEAHHEKSTRKREREIENLSIKEAG